MASSRRILLALLCCLALVPTAGAIPGTPPGDCDTYQYAVYATDEDPGNVSDGPFTGVYENQSAAARAVFDRARQREGSFVTLDESEGAAVWTLPNVVVVNETGTVYRTQRQSGDCGVPWSVGLAELVAGLAVVALGLAGTVVHLALRGDGAV